MVRVIAFGQISVLIMSQSRLSILTASSFCVFFMLFDIYIFLSKCFAMYVQTCEKVEVMITLENNRQSVTSSLIMLQEEIENK